MRNSTDTYDCIAPHYDAGISRFEKWFIGELRRKTLGQLPADGFILEVGAGTGLNFSYYLHSRGVASEPSRGMLGIAQSKSRPEEINLIQCCAENIPFRDATFDAAVATLVFCSVRSPGDGFAELRRVLKPQGKLLLLEHVRPPGLLGYLFDVLNAITAPLFGDHLNRRTAEMVRSAGFQVGHVESRWAGIINLVTCTR